MQLALTAASIVNAGGGLFFLLVGVGVLAVARGSTRSILIGATATLFGLTYVIENVVGYASGDATGAILLAVVAGPTALVQLVLAWHLTRSLSAHERRRSRWLAAALATSFGLAHVAFGRAEVLLAWGFDASAAGRASAIALNAQQWGMIVLVWAAGARSRAAVEARERRAFLAFGLAFAFFGVFLHVGTYLSLLTPGGDLVALVSNVGIAVVVLLATTPVLAFAGGDSSRGPAERLASPALVVAGLVGLALAQAGPIEEGRFGSFGIVRTIGAALLALAIVKYDLLGVELPRVAQKRGAMAAGALAAVLIVAQVAQNFFAAKYGLLMGGIVAGAFLFAAAPLQRALESKPDPRRIAASASDEHEGSFRAAVRMALKDDNITREEERHLVVLADHLGIRPARAYELRDEEERARKG